MIRVTPELTVNPRMVASVEVDHRHYMNGSDSVLVIHMENGQTHRVRHGYGIDVYAIEKAILAAA